MKISMKRLKQIILKNKDLTPEELRAELENAEQEEAGEFEFDETSVELSLDDLLNSTETMSDDLTVELNLNERGEVKMQAKAKV
ncbi:MAG: hypothetical protein D6675_10150 [Gemmatimonadetes bacterium]|nr:MAG: hypothetical protein D6675_10150 [Gemmatimonadota bacterium]